MQKSFFLKTVKKKSITNIALFKKKQHLYNTPLKIYTFFKNLDGETKAH